MMLFTIRDLRVVIRNQFLCKSSGIGIQTLILAATIPLENFVAGSMYDYFERVV